MIAARLAVAVFAAAAIGTISIVALEQVFQAWRIEPIRVGTLFVIVYLLPGFVAWHLMVRWQTAGQRRRRIRD